MKDSEGDFSPWHDVDRKCYRCGGQMEEREWESHCGGYTDYKYRCKECMHTFWIDGDDG